MNFIQQRSVDNFKPSGSFKQGIYGFQMDEKNKKYHVQLLSAHNIEPRVHFMKGVPPTLCNHLYFDKDDPDKTCELCEKPPSNPKYKHNSPSLIRGYVGYVFEFYKLMKKAKNSDTEFEEKPTKVIGIFSGKKGVHFKPFNDVLEEEGEAGLLNSIWNFENNEELGFITPTRMTNTKKLGDQYDLNLARDAQKEWDAKPEAEVQSVILSAYANCRWDHPDMIAAGYANPFPDDGAGSIAKGDSEQKPVSAEDLG